MVPLETVAMFWMGTGPAYPAGTEKVAVMVRVDPGVMLVREQGKALTQSPLFDTKVRPVGVTSATTTAVAFAGPLLVTVMV